MQFIEVRFFLEIKGNPLISEMKNRIWVERSATSEPINCCYTTRANKEYCERECNGARFLTKYKNRRVFSEPIKSERSETRFYSKLRRRKYFA